MKHARVDAELPDELVYSILLNLPPKTLLRFRSVSKRWNDIITSRAFAKHHCMNARSKPRADHLLQFCKWCKDDQTLYYTKLNGHVSSSCGVPPSPVKFQLPPKLYEYSDQTTKGGFWFGSSSCDGMLCTATYEPDNTATILVWNPFTRQFRRVPWPGVYTKFNTLLTSFVGFGYDHTSDDYKIVVHTYDFSASVFRTYVTALRSSNSNVWRSIEELSMPWGKRSSRAVTLDNGDVYWVSWSSGPLSDNISEEYYWKSCNPILEQGRFLILKFSFTDERLTVMPSPPKEHDLGKPMWNWQLREYEGSLYFYNYLDEFQAAAPTTHWAHIWTLIATPDNINGGSKATWVKAMQVPFGALFRSYDWLLPLGFTVSGDLVMRIFNRLHTRTDDGDLMVYLARECRFVVVHLKDDDEAGSKSVTYYHFLQTETLISPN
uniref:F-box domain-containing protein n=1 Tax=Kalanchoe fedtschenkoi TaxID=63787 RepID=A0A7N0VDM0_KALFE